MGFRADEASAALRSSNGNVQQAIDALLNRRSVPTGRGTARQSSYESRDGDRGAGRGRRERKDDDDGMYNFISFILKLQVSSITTGRLGSTNLIRDIRGTRTKEFRIKI